MANSISVPFIGSVTNMSKSTSSVAKLQEEHRWTQILPAGGDAQHGTDRSAVMVDSLVDERMRAEQTYVEREQMTPTRK